MRLINISELELIYKKVGKITNLREYGFGEGVADTIGNMTLGEVLLRTNNLATHIGLRNVGDKNLNYLRQAIRETKEYKALNIEHN
jgi:hypothetical protein